MVKNIDLQKKSKLIWVLKLSYFYTLSGLLLHLLSRHWLHPPKLHIDSDRTKVIILFNLCASLLIFFGHCKHLLLLV